MAGADGGGAAPGPRRGPRLATLGAAPWRRAPLLLWRRPGVLLAAAGAVAVVAASLAAVPLFLSSAGTEAVTIQAGERCPRDTGATLTAPVDDPDPLGHPDPFVPVADDLGPSSRWGRFDSVLEAGDERTPVVVLTHDGAADHVDLVEGGDRPGAALLSDRAVALTGAEGRDTVEIGGLPVPVGGVYADLAAGTVDDPFWCAHRTDLPLRGAELIPPRPVVLVDEATWTRLRREADLTGVLAVWQAPLRPDRTLGAAQRLVDDLGCRGGRSSTLAWCADGSPPSADGAAALLQGDLDSSLPFVVERGRAIQTAVAGGVWPVAGLAALAGLGLVAATALLWCDRRRREVALLTVRGVGPAAIGLKAVLELSAALVVGAAAGVTLAWALVVSVGPSPVVEGSALGRAAVLGLVAALGSGAVTAAVATARSRTVGSSVRPRPWRRWVPWELALAAVTIASYRRLGAWGTPVADGSSVSHVDVVGLLFPVLFLATAVLLAARLLGLALGPLRRASASWRPALFLGLRRVARYRTAVTGMVVASALAAGVFAYAATIQRSMEATLEAKALVYLGGDVVVRVPQGEALPEALAGRSTSVDLYSHAWIGDRHRLQVNVFAIDPATFAGGSFWDDSLADEPLDELVARLVAPTEDGSVPVILVGASAPALAPAAIVTTGTTEFDIEQVATVAAFPGMRRGSPALFVAAPALERLGLSTRVREVRVRGDRSEVLAALDEAGVAYQEATTAGHVVDAVSFLTVAQTFGFLRTLSLAAAALVVGGVAVYLDARRRGRVLAYAFARRMGLRRREHRGALLVELLAGIGAGGALGTLVALAGAALAHAPLDPLPDVDPTPVLRPATGLLLAVVATSVLVAVVAAALAQRATDRDEPVEVLRGGT